MFGAWAFILQVIMHCVEKCLAMQDYHFQGHFNDTGSLSTDTFTELAQVSFLSHTVAAFFKLGNSLEVMNGILVSPIYCRTLTHAV